MIALRLARGRGRKLRTDEARRYRLTVSELLGELDPASRLTADFWVRLDPLRVEARPRGSDPALLSLSTSTSTYGVRYWLTCPKCARRCGAVYWVGHGDIGRWACWKCAGLQQAAAALHRTIEGDRLILSGEVRANLEQHEAARERESRRFSRAVRQLYRQLE